MYNKTPENINDLVTIKDAAVYLKNKAKQYREELSKENKEELAAQMGIITNDHFEVWAEQCPIINNIEGFTSDLEWSNSLDVDEDWEKLIALIDDLYQQVAKK